jgi:molybdenum cofactor cytidylyltransferase
MSSSGLCGVILAAGQSSRMGRDKALLPWPKTDAPTAGPPSTLLSSSIHALSDHCDIVLVVAGTNADALRPVVYACGADVVVNTAPEREQFSSLQVGLHEVLNRGRDSAMVTLVDRPPLQPQTLSALVAAFDARPHNIWAVVPEYQSAHGHPILVGREMIEAFLRAPVTSNAREVEHTYQQRIAYLETADALVTTNLDTPEAYASLHSVEAAP